MKNFTITHRQSSGNLHISIAGEFNGQCAWTLLRTIEEYYELPGRVFVQTEQISSIKEKGLLLYKQAYNSRRVPLQNFYFKGKTGFKIALDGQRVLLSKKNCQSSQKQILKKFSRCMPAEHQKKQNE